MLIRFPSGNKSNDIRLPIGIDYDQQIAPIAKAKVYKSFLVHCIRIFPSKSVFVF
jgi:hypothetical protein